MEETISAEVIPEQTKESLAAEALRGLGFRILSINEVIFLQGEKSLFEQTFGIHLEELSKSVLPDISERTLRKYWKHEGEVTVPKELEGLVQEVLFPEPPQFF